MFLPPLNGRHPASVKSFIWNCCKWFKTVWRRNSALGKQTVTTWLGKSSLLRIYRCCFSSLAGLKALQNWRILLEFLGAPALRAADTREVCRPAHAAALHETHSSFKADTTHSHVESHLCAEVGVVFNMLGIVLRKIAVWVFRTLNTDVAS